jgi:hypothetical protein
MPHCVSGYQPLNFCFTLQAIPVYIYSFRVLPKKETQCDAMASRLQMSLILVWHAEIYDRTPIAFNEEPEPRVRPVTKPTTQLLPAEAITHRILVLRQQKVLLDSDLAALYGVDTRRLNEQVRRNRERFPPDFIFELTTDEFSNLKSQFATSSWGGRRKLPLAFTEHGAIMAATVLNSPRAVEVSVYVVRAFVQMRELAATHRELAQRLDALEKKTGMLAAQHDVFSRNTRLQLKQVFDALRDLMVPPDPPRRPIGFVPPLDKNDKSRGSAAKKRQGNRG